MTPTAPKEGLFVGGIQPGQESIDWTGFTVDILPESMSQTDNQVLQAHAMQMIQVAPEIIQMKMTMPGLNVDYIINQLGEAWNIKNLSKMIFNEQGLQKQMAQQQMQAQQPQPGQPPGPGGGPSPMSSLTANTGMGFPGGGLANAHPQPKSPVFPTNKNGQGMPLYKSQGPGMSPLPKQGLPKTQSVGRA